MKKIMLREEYIYEICRGSYWKDIVIFVPRENGVKCFEDLWEIGIAGRKPKICEIMLQKENTVLKTCYFCTNGKWGVYISIKGSWQQKEIKKNNKQKKKKNNRCT